ncbi:hypothetical protein IU500_22115 [Nocardia terpenica]|uniref:hypothetical protein n=1 Tax=Nocardia terpenica TaxID=455432 RepID=UPI001895B91C|nr:hypothetical protein [Nocardia terpenica]MBF6106735.1 hypothetical protein [Nocardia terpenica]MBF6114609.1 hypothetical protein [Nocardia terpenica]MBF6121305.1 hypothetical protein [Nocardia terpenica]
MLAGRHEIGQTDASTLTDDRPGPRLLLLAGRSWRVTYIDWKRRRLFVEQADGGGVAKWSPPGLRGLSFALAQAMRDVVCGCDPPVPLTRRAIAALANQRTARATTAKSGTTIIQRDGQAVRWWTWAGFRANATLAHSLASITETDQRPTDLSIRLRPDLTPQMWREALTQADLVLPAVDPRAVNGLEFATLLPEHLAAATVAARLADNSGAQQIMRMRTRFLVSTP